MICLQNLCINLIAEKFERFYFSFIMLNNEKTKRNLQFLQIRYSAELGSELFKRGKLKEKYLRFIINKHLKFLDEQWIYETPLYRHALEDIFRCVPNLTKIFCKTITDEILQKIAEFFPKIVEIDGTRSIITDSGVEYLCQNKNGSVPCSELKKLNIRFSDVTDEGLANLLRNLRYLEELDDMRIPPVLYSLHKEDLPKLENVPTYNIVELNMFYETDKPYYNDLLKICLTACPKLKSLKFADIKDNEQLSYFNHSFLEHLAISFRELGQKINIDSFLKKCGRNMRFLSLHHCILSISELAVSYPKLRELYLTDVTFTDYRANSKVVFASLDECIFHKFEMDSENIKAMNMLLFSSPNLKDVTFLCCDLCPDLKNSILKCCENVPLENIEFNGITIVELSFAKGILIRCPSLKYFGVGDCDYSLEEREELMQFVETLPNRSRLHIPCLI